MSLGRKKLLLVFMCAPDFAVVLVSTFLAEERVCEKIALASNCRTLSALLLILAFQ